MGNNCVINAEKNLFDKKNIKSNLQTIFLGRLIMTKPAASFNNSCMMAKATYELLIMLYEIMNFKYHEMYKLLFARRWF